jgi:hypothetical protein
MLRFSLRCAFLLMLVVCVCLALSIARLREMWRQEERILVKIGSRAEVEQFAPADGWIRLLSDKPFRVKSLRILSANGWDLAFTKAAHTRQTVRSDAVHCAAENGGRTLR